MVSIIPKPASMEVGDGQFVLNAQTVLAGSPGTEKPVSFLQQALGTATGFPLPAETSPEAGGPCIELILAPGLSQEGYRLTVISDKVTIESSASNGLFYGIQTLLQLLPPEIYKSSRQPNMTWAVPCVEIVDEPRFPWRGMHLDVSRHFMPKEYVKKFIDLLALHKFNVFHWHLTDDQGWRIEIKRYPKLTEVGAWRKETLIGHHRQPVESWQFDNTPHGGFYTQDDVREIVAYAAKRYITVVPEIDMPGHMRAAIAAYPELGLPGGPVDVWTGWGISTGILNTEPETLQFMKNILQEIMELFPSQYIHIGGDEVVKQPWKDDSRTQSKIRELGLADENELQSWFIRQMDEFLTERGRRLIGWDEILEGGLAPGAVVMSWRGEDGGIAAANAGHKVVMAPCTHTYFDHYQADPDSEPLAIEGFTPLEKVYGYNPVPPAIQPDCVKYILGAQGQVWTEFMPTPQHIDYMVFPRACALAEVVWTPIGQRDFEEFQERLETHLRRLDGLGVCYHGRPAAQK